MGKKQLIILGGFSLVLAIMVFGPILAKLQQNLSNSRELKKTNSLLEKKLTILQGIDKNLVNSRVTKMELVFPSQKPIVALLSTLSQLSAKHSLGFGGVSLHPGSLTNETKTQKSKTASLNDLKFGFEVSGNFAAILTFMQELERAAPLMRIDKIGLTIKTTPLFNASATLVSAKIEVTSFYQAAPESLGSITQPVNLLNRNDEAILSTLFTFTQFPTVLPVAETGKADLFQTGP